jgi:hypothetical protein
MSAALEPITPGAMVVPSAFGADAPAAGVSPAEFATVFRHYSAGNSDLPPKEDAIRQAHLNMGLRVFGSVFIDEQGGRSWWAF